ncbi:MAG: low molecular weight phosphotyrosine protein phosphatase [Myxococcales bacterium]|nr:low molecular weight phosphotyrosine protein phosphatase [Myxococcales bacterium]
MAAIATAPRGVLFVCYANICRSPLAEGIFRHRARERGLEDQVRIDSAGVSAWAGADPHQLSVAVAAEHGIALEGRARQLIRDDFYTFDEVIVMDRLVHGEIRRLLGPSAFGPQAPIRAEIRLFRRILDPRAEGRELDVADPVGGGIEGFRAIFRLLEAGCDRLLDEIAADR